MFSCYVIGETSLTLLCLDTLVKEGHQILGLVSSDADSKQWASKNKIPYFSSIKAFMAVAKDQPCDYLFNILNNQILPAELLNLPTKYPINFHDALLPKYAGLNASSWAVLNGEKTHGISWHVMTQQVNAGDILQQAEVDIAPDETALSLKLKCYAQATLAFARLIKALATDSAIRYPQDLSLRTYYPGNKVLPLAGFIDWSQPAADIERYSRALEFGQYPNKLGVLKFVHNAIPYVVKHIEMLNISTGELPGTVIEADTDELIVATYSYDIKLTKLTTLEGLALSLGDFIQQTGLRPGQRLGMPDKASLSHGFDKLMSSEEYWLTALRCIEPIQLPFITQHKLLSDAKIYQTSAELSKQALERLTNHFSSYTQQEILLAGLFIYLYKINQHLPFSARMAGLNALTKLPALANWLEQSPPLIVALDSTWQFSELLAEVKRLNILLQKHETYAKDLPARYQQATLLDTIPLTIATLDHNPALRPETKICIQLNEIGYALQASLAEDELDLHYSLARVLNQVSALVEAVALNPELQITHMPLLSQADKHIVTHKSGFC